MPRPPSVPKPYVKSGQLVVILRDPRTGYRQTDHLRRRAIAAAGDTDATTAKPERFHDGPLDGLDLHVAGHAWAWCLSCFGVIEGPPQVMTYHREFDGMHFRGIADPAGRPTAAHRTP